MKRVIFILMIVVVGVSGAMGQTATLGNKSQTLCEDKTPKKLSIVETSFTITSYRWERKLTETYWDSVGNLPTYSPEALIGTNYYCCIITTDEYGDIMSDIAVITVNPKPIIAVHPAISAPTAKCYNTGTFPQLRVDATGTGTLTYQWYSNTTNSTSGGTIISGATSSTYDPPSTVVGNFYYYCIVTGTCGNATSNMSSVHTVRPEFRPGSIIPGRQTVCLNDTAKTIEGTPASGGDGNIEYCWIIKDSVTKHSDTIRDAGPAYIPHTNKSGTFIYKREARDRTCDTTWKASLDSCTLIVRPAFDAGNIGTKDAVVCLNDKLPQIRVEATSGGDGIFSYQWKMNGDIIPSAKDSTLTYTPRADSAGTFIYTCEVKNGCSANEYTPSSGSWLLIVNPLPERPEELVGDITLCQYTDTLTKYYINSASTLHATNYEWKILPDTAGQILGSGDIISVLWNPNFYGTADLQVIAINNCGSNSNSFKINMNKSPKIKFVQAPNPVCGNQQGLIYIVDSLKDVTYKWEIDAKGKILDTNKNKVTVDWVKTNSVTTGTIIATATDDDNGCSYASKFEVAISADSAPTMNDIVPKGDPIYMLVYPNPKDKDLAYQWYKDGNLITDATKQFYYPKTSDKDGATYKVCVAFKNSASCENCIEYPTKLKLSNGSPSSAFTIFPNPVSNDYFTVSFNRNLLQDNSASYVLSIYSVIGGKIWEQTINSLDDISIAKTMTTGIYMITLTTNKQQYSEKIIIR